MFFCLIFQKRNSKITKNLVSVACSNAQITSAENEQLPDNRISLLRADY
jgi:hypothetical protein